MKVFKNFDLTDYNSYRIRSSCLIAYFPDSESDIIRIFRDLKDQDFVILGNGNNIILSKSFYNSPFIILNKCFNKINVDDVFIEAEAGATTLELSETALKYNLTRAEFLYDIPSSIGGAVYMNAGTKEGEIKNILIKVRYLDLEDLIIKEKSGNEINLSYRDSFFQKKGNKIVLKAWFELEHGNLIEIKKMMQESKDRRWSKQPREFPNCGSVFKRPPNKYVGPMLDELGFKGFTIGGAKVSEKHSGFIVNKGDATGADILGIIQEIQAKVRTKFDIDIEVEQRII